eukprot:scaffold31476_cov23-Cyclotella_meneghiniana.AAC.2
MADCLRDGRLEDIPLAPTPDDYRPNWWELIKYMKIEFEKAVMTKSVSGSAAKPKDLALAMNTFKGKCHKCGKTGHMKKGCPNAKAGVEGNKNNNNGNSKGYNKTKKNRGHRIKDGKDYGPAIKGNCNECGKAGHMGKYCGGIPVKDGEGGDGKEISAPEFVLFQVDGLMGDLDDGDDDASSSEDGVSSVAVSLVWDSQLGNVHLDSDFPRLYHDMTCEAICSYCGEHTELDVDQTWHDKNDGSDYDIISTVCECCGHARRLLVNDRDGKTLFMDNLAVNDYPLAISRIEDEVVVEADDAQEARTTVSWSEPLVIHNESDNQLHFTDEVVIAA